ncbi:TetR/AcrR family transcriptional regulator [Virgibacillus alimentarius]|uniref:AcrR family transcriptional regulator n=1 Tax=Virgibacillus alimentarius TaxID=698769 RepID=A0ABS4S7D2_9BACI|nr:MULTISPECIES: TetR/AcrR family transcriptional regulator [Virgibacillus]MBP2257398.1 AcrR family transcriptional regulator [Virgibacillus alimentarius]HLR67748.1 TetR/AcrR family transcriptional regulator [Virgibacillus sp.]
MNEKKRKLIESGVKLFATKGYHQTSIQEIATDAGISKGGFYLYFHSKETFIASAIEHFQKQIFERMEAVGLENIPPRQRLAKQMTVLTEYIFKYKGFIIMHLREDISMGKSADDLIKQTNIRSFHWLKQSIYAIYGEHMKPYLVDSIIQLEGLMHSYFKCIVIDHIDISAERIGSFLMKRLDDIVYGMMRGKEDALITEEMLPYKYEVSLLESELEDVLFHLEAKIDHLYHQGEEVEKLYEVRDELRKEMRKEEPQTIIIQGLLAHFVRIDGLKDECQEIARRLNVELLD